MPRPDKVSSAVAAVGLKALHDRAFFGQLLESPRETLLAQPGLVPQSIQEDVIKEVEQLIERRRGKSVQYFLERWDRYHDSGEWGEEWQLNVWF
jgi:hypothetical protein